jgi:hypothetical protein
LELLHRTFNTSSRAIKASTRNGAHGAVEREYLRSPRARS